MRTVIFATYRLAKGGTASRYLHCALNVGRWLLADAVSRTRLLNKEEAHIMADDRLSLSLRRYCLDEYSKPSKSLG